MIIRGHFVADVPYFTVHLQSPWFEGTTWLLADTGAARTTLLDREIKHLGIPLDVEIAFVTSEGDFLLQQNIWVTQHNLDSLPPEEVSRILRLPSVLGRDIINRFRLICDYGAGQVLLERT